MASFPFKSSVLPRPCRGLGPRSAVQGFPFATEPEETGARSFLLPKLRAVMNGQHRFPKPQHPEHLPEQAGAFPKPCPSHPILQRHSVPQLYCGKCSLGLRLPVLSRTTGPGARQRHRTSLLCESGKGSLVFSEQPRLASKAQRGYPAKLAASTRPCWTLESQRHATFMSVGWRMCRKLKNKVKGKSREFSQGLARPPRRQINCPLTSRLRHSH